MLCHISQLRKSTKGVSFDHRLQQTLRLCRFRGWSPRMDTPWVDSLVRGLHYSVYGLRMGVGLTRSDGDESLTCKQGGPLKQGGLTLADRTRSSVPSFFVFPPIQLIMSY